MKSPTAMTRHYRYVGPADIASRVVTGRGAVIDSVESLWDSLRSMDGYHKGEIAYGTLPGHEGKGVATAMAGELIRIAQSEDPSLIVFAQTLPEENASTSILKKHGFTHIGSVEHPEDGTVNALVGESEGFVLGLAAASGSVEKTKTLLNAGANIKFTSPGATGDLSRMGATYRKPEVK